MSKGRVRPAMLVALLIACVVLAALALPPRSGDAGAYRTSAGAFLAQAPGEPTANAGPDRTVKAWQTITFDGSGSTDDVGVVNYTWTFDYDDESQTLYEVAPEFTFYTPGTYVVTLNVTDADGHYDLDTVTIVVEENLLMAYWTLLLVAGVFIVVIVAFVRFQRRKEMLSPRVVATYGVLTALTAAVTMATFVPFAPTKGYFNAGDSIVFFSALAFGWRTAGVCGGFGSAAADIMLGSGFFAPLTLIAKGSEGAVCGLLRKLGKDKGWATVLGIVVGGSCMVLTYFLGELYLLYVGPGAALLEAAGNTLQVVVGGTVGALLSHYVKKAYPSLKGS